MSGTNLGKMPILIIALVIGVIMATTAIIPLVDSYGESVQKTVTNPIANSNPMKYTNDLEDLDVTITWTSPNTYFERENGDKITFTAYNSSIIVTDKGHVAKSINGDPYGTILDSTTSGTAYPSSIQKIVVTINDTTVTVNGIYEDTDHITTWTDVSWVAYPDLDGEYKRVQKTAATTEFTISGDQTIFGVSWINTDNTGFWAFDGTTSNVGTMIFEKEAVSGYVDLYSYTYSTDYYLDPEVLTNADSSYIVPYYAWVPFKSTTVTDTDSAYNDLVKIVPMMAFVALIAAAAFMIYSKRD